MNCGPRFLLFALSMLPFLGSPTYAASPNVVASILPVHSLVAGVMRGVGEPYLLVQGNASPHDFAFSPSSARALQSSQAVFWVGPNVEPFLEKPLRSLSGQANVVALSQHVRLLRGREGGAWEQHGDHEAGHDEHGHKEAGHDEHGHKEASHDEHGHNESSHDEADHHDADHHEPDHKAHDADNTHAMDMHVWLDPGNAKAMVRIIVATLQETDAANAAAYAANGAALIQRLDGLDTALKDILSPVRAMPYVVFHDAYQYFERHFGLNAIGSITISPDRSPGARRLVEIRQKIQETGARCVFAEPQFTPALVRTVVEGTPAKAASLDPLGALITPGPDAWFTLMEALATSLRDCLAAKG